MKLRTLAVGLVAVLFAALCIAQLPKPGGGSGGGGAGDVTGPASSVDSEVALFSGTGGKTLKRASSTGVLKAASGVLSVVSGSASDCVKVDGSSGSCGGGGGTQRISILDWRVLPDSSGNVFYEPYPTKATNDFWKHGHWVFNNPGADLKIFGAINIPANYTGSANLVVVWTSTVTSGNFGIEFGYRCVGGNDAESLDQNSAQETVNTTDVAPGATDRRMEISVALTSSNCVAGDTMLYYFARDDSADTLAGAVSLVDLLLEYQ